MRSFITVVVAVAALLVSVPPVWGKAAEEGATAGGSSQVAASRRVEIPAGVAVVGADKKEIVRQLEGTAAQPRWYADESPRRTVKVDAFFIDRTEVTNTRYKTLITTHEFPPNLTDNPVVNITFIDAETFCRNAGGRLPTEAQWERAARGDAGFIYPWGNEFDGTRAVYKDSVGGKSGLKIGSYEREVSSSRALGGTHRVGSMSHGASPFGLLDMAGNAWEWVDGYYDRKKGLRLLKGGSWLAPKASLRASARLGDPGLKRYNDFGFRCAYEKVQ